MNITAKTRIKLRDRDGNTGIMIHYWNSGIDQAAIADDLINVAIPIIQSLSDAVVYGLAIEYYDSVSGGSAGDESDIGRKVGLFYEDSEGNLNVLYALSPINLFEASGDYAGIRVDNSLVSDFIDSINTLNLKTLDGLDFGTYTGIGGLVY